MNIKFNIFISHDSQDETIALELKSFLEDIFLNSNVYVSGRDLEGGQTWIENIKLSLKSSQVIISIVSKKSINNKWMFFETGAGFVEDKSIPFICDGIKFNDLTPPLSLLQARTLSAQGVEALVQDIASKLNLRKPRILSSLEKLLSETDKFLNIRNSEEEPVIEEAITVQKNKSSKNEGFGNDEEVFNYYEETNKRLRTLVIKKMLSFSDRKDIPSREELESYTKTELKECMNALNIEFPNSANLNLLLINMDMPKKDDKRWKKINALKKLEDANSMLDKYEKDI